MAAYTGKKPIGTPHDRFYDARAAQRDRGYWVGNVGQLGGGRGHGYLLRRQDPVRPLRHEPRVAGRLV